MKQIPIAPAVDCEGMPMAGARLHIFDAYGMVFFLMIGMRLMPQHLATLT